MSWFNITAVAVGLAMDAFAVSVAAGLGLKRVTHAHVARMALSFGLFQFMMPILGWYAGLTVADHIRAFDHWIAFTLLTALGGKMLWDARTGEARQFRGDPTVGWRLLTLSVATSIDALAAGLSMAMLNVDIWAPSVVIGAVAAALTAVGIKFGGRITKGPTRWADLLGGTVLIGVGAKILIQHLSRNGM